MDHLCDLTNQQPIQHVQLLWQFWHTYSWHTGTLGTLLLQAHWHTCTFGILARARSSTFGTLALLAPWLEQAVADLAHLLSAHWHHLAHLLQTALASKGYRYWHTCTFWHLGPSRSPTFGTLALSAPWLEETIITSLLHKTCLLKLSQQGQQLHC